MQSKHLLIHCQAVNRAISFTKLDEDDLRVCIYRYGGPLHVWKHRFWFAWQVLAKGVGFTDQVVLTKEETEELKDFL